MSCFIITIVKHNNNYIVYLNYYVEKKSETLSKRALQASKDQMSMVVYTNSEVTCNLQAGSSDVFLQHVTLITSINLKHYSQKV